MVTIAALYHNPFSIATAKLPIEDLRNGFVVAQFIAHVDGDESLRFARVQGPDYEPWYLQLRKSYHKGPNPPAPFPRGKGAGGLGPLSAYASCTTFQGDIEAASLAELAFRPDFAIMQFDQVFHDR